MPSSLKVLNIKRKWRNTTYHIRIENPEAVDKGVVTIIVNGKKYAGNQIPYFKDNNEVNVLVIMGKPVNNRQVDQAQLS
jgi:cellobiose phosphorylase